MMNPTPFLPILREDGTGITAREKEDLLSAGTPSFISNRVSFGNVSWRECMVLENGLDFPAMQRRSGSDRYDGLLPYASRRVYRETNILKFTQLKEEGST